MRYAVKYTLAATLVAGAAASGHHNHQHFHAKKEAASPVEKREPDAVTAYVVDATATVYELNGEVVDAEEAKEGIDQGNFVVVGETTPTFSPPPPPPPPTTTSSSSTPDLGAQFIESPSTTSTPPPPPPPSSSSAPAPSPSPVDTSGSSNGGGQGLDSKFPSGKVPCSEFPSDYGAVPLDWLDFGGWSGLQFVPNFFDGALSISDIITGISGETCSEQCMCSYACPPGYQKTQWPKAQGATLQSIGGLFCNSDGYLELTRPEYDTLCEKGVGGVSVQNDLDEVVATCRTDYPGTENMVVPATANPGETVDLCNPDQETYYIWDGSATTAQYYLNKAGISTEDACVWNSPVDPEGAGNWAPIILGVGKAADGNTYLSIFQNLPTSTAKLNFNVEVTGDVNAECSYIDGQWTGGSSGCTTTLQPGGSAVYRFF